MNAVIEIYEVRQIVDTCPLNRPAGFPTVAYPLRGDRIRPNLRVTRHARFSRGKARKVRSLNTCVAVAAVNAIVLHVMFMTEENRLLAGYADKRYPGAPVYRVAQSDCATNQYNRSSKRYSEDCIRAAAK